MRSKPNFSTRILLNWFATIVTLINVSQLTAISVRYIYDRDGFARDFVWARSTRRSAVKFPYHGFYFWIACLAIGLIHNALFAIGKAFDTGCVNVIQFVSVVIGLTKKLVS